MTRREFVEGAHQQLEQGLAVSIQQSLPADAVQKKFINAIATAGPASCFVTLISVEEDAPSTAIKEEVAAISIKVQVLIHAAHSREAESLAGVLTTELLNARLAQVDFPPVSIIEPWPAIQPYDANVSVLAAEALPVQLHALDKGGNVAHEPLNVSVSLMEQQQFSRTFECKGQSSCHALVNVQVPLDYVLVEAFLEISVECTDFDYATEHLQKVSVGGFDLLKIVGSPVNPGPFPGCFSNCGSYANVLSKYSVVSQVRQAAFSQEQSIPVLMETSPDVNLFPCDGFVLSALVTLQMTWAVPSSPDNYLGPALVNMLGSYQLHDAAIRRSSGFYLLRFWSPGVRQTQFYWISIATGQPSKILLLLQPTNSTGGVLFSRQPLVAISDAGNNVVDGSNALFSVELSAPMAVCVLSAPALRNVSCEASFCHANVGVGTGRRSVSLEAQNLIGSLDLKVLGSGNYTDLSVSVAAMGYQLRFSAVVSLPNSSVVFQAESALFSIVTGPAVRLALYKEPPKHAFGGQPLLPNPVVAASDFGGNFVGLMMDEKLEVTAGIGANGAVAGKLRGARVLVMNSESSANCCANFTDLSLTLRGSGYTIIFAAPGLLSVESTSINILTGPVSQLRMLRCAARGSTDLPLSPQPVLQLEDAGGNQIWMGNYNVSVRLLPASDLFSADFDQRMHGHVANISTFNGRAYFYDLIISAARPDWSLEFFLEGHVSVNPFVASSINITAAAGSVIVQGDVTFTRLLQDESTGLSRLEGLAFVESLAQVLGLPPEHITILEIFLIPESMISARRRSLLALVAYKVIIKFEVFIGQEDEPDDTTNAPTTPTSGSSLRDSVSNTLSRLTKQSLQEALAEHGVEVAVQELQILSKPKIEHGKASTDAFLMEEDIWNGWWMIETPMGPAAAGIAYNTQRSLPLYTRNNTLELMVHLGCGEAGCNSSYSSCVEHCIVDAVTNNSSLACCQSKCASNGSCTYCNPGSKTLDGCCFEHFLYSGLACSGTAQDGIGALACYRAQFSNILSQTPVASLRIETLSQVALHFTYAHEPCRLLACLLSLEVELTRKSTW
jgi:hypothetical protein